MTRSKSPPSSTAQRSRKAVLVCPDCGHESPTDGDWDVREEERDGHLREAYRCPNCGTTITTRPRFVPSRIAVCDA